MNEKVEPAAVMLANAALVGTGIVHLYLFGVMLKARLIGYRADSP